jgi:hypothetical protein
MWRGLVIMANARVRSRLISILVPHVLCCLKTPFVFLPGTTTLSHSARTFLTCCSSPTLAVHFTLSKLKLVSESSFHAHAHATPRHATPRHATPRHATPCHCGT